MILPSQNDALHRGWLYRILTAFLDDPLISANLYFKGGTCAAMLGWLDRFSIDLDFDFMGNENDIPIVREKCERLFNSHDLIIDDSSKKVIQYFLKYPAHDNERNTLKIDTAFPPNSANEYRAFRFPEIDRIAYCQTRETAFANKLVACMDRKKIAGRDIYDIHHFFLQGFKYSPAVIEARHEGGILQFFKELELFVRDSVTQTSVDQDINMLLPVKRFQQVRLHLKQETLMLIRDEIARLK
ncbi:MAG: nucleotidyl transferase AbiEii/AbiGii toxin family protein [bacterium]|nr:nucleotidyl transferase AbiEii/AbiGii toxin family protein [bacterium]